MKKRLPPLNWLRSFEASARHQNFTSAANELNLTQAAISQQVKNLESQLGAVLFKRLPRGIELTDAGLAYMPAVHESINRLSSITDELFGNSQNRPLIIRASLVFFTTWLAPRVNRFYQEFPDINIRFTSNIWREDKDKKNEYDLDIRYGQGNWPDIKAEQLTWDELFPVCSPNLLMGLSSPLSIDILKEHTLLHVLGYEEGWGYWLNTVNSDKKSKHSGIQFDTLISALEMAKLGQGFALGRTSLVKSMLENGSLVAPFEESIKTSEAFYLTYPNHQYLTPNAEKFRQWILNESKI
ncbi:LysR substrate-binding domain-containing protein [Marinomonas pollencensis]|uniref:LysR family transcriptional regulator n=1 Tax=Marinomonas pollencensis TaxID=491954 RepID=A0A3E0DTP1_9GAMM|nr:LysR substrate-binding domain-containing protein [Marinomonas pollencensis]REG86939.1 LysR family transcriptional regulator [Marinomonas pollencensis]